MSRLFPHPVLAVGLLILWLLLQQSLSVGHILLGSAIGIATGIATSALGLTRPRVRRPFKIVRLFMLVTYDVMRSNLAVAWIILTQRAGPKSAGFLRVPLELRDRTALAFLAIILTSTPGTVWLEFDEDRGELLLHVLDLIDDQTWIDIIKNRYERLLLEILKP